MMTLWKSLSTFKEEAERSSRLEVIAYLRLIVRSVGLDGEVAGAVAM